MFSESAINWEAVKATKRGFPVVADVIFKWIILEGSGLEIPGLHWPDSTGQTTRPARHARKIEITKSAEVPCGKEIESLVSEPLSPAKNNCRKVQNRELEISAKAN
jgi:hypothetical protein